MTWLDNQWYDINISSWLVLLSIGGYIIGLWGYRRSAGNPLCHPLLISTPLVAAALYLSNIDFNSYYAGNGILNWLLGPTTVALAVPLARQMPQLPPLLITVLTTVILGGLFAVICAVAIAAGLGGDHVVLLSLAAKSVTTPIAVGITEQIGGLVTLMVMVVLLTGIIGILVAQRIFRYQHIADERWQGLILGVSAHAIGTAKAFEKSPRCGAFATLGMGLNGIWTSIFLPTLLPLLIF
ncbi:MAG: LrgB family protein [Porticoccaceae bacterium]|nr:LrgB family protein [Porticoccaceae bacterium]